MSTDAVIFDGAEPEPADAEKAEQEQVEAPKGEKTEVEPEKEATKEEAKEADSQESSPDPESSVIPITALHGERDRRKAAEARAKELEEQLSSKDEAEPTSVFTDETKFRDEILSKVEQDRLADRLEMSEKFARRFHGDEVVDKAMDWFIPAAQENPTLQKKFNDAGNDVDKVVELFKANEAVSKLDDPEALERELAKAREEGKAEALKELQAAQAKKSELTNSIPESLVDDSSSGSLGSKTVKAPTDEELFG